MCKKDAASYEGNFALLKQKANDAAQQFEPSYIMSDFESGFITAVASSFPHDVFVSGIRGLLGLPDHPQWSR